MSIIVKVMEIPGITREVGLEDGSTAQNALEIAGVTVGDGQKLQVDGRDATHDTVLTNEARVTVSKGAKGNK